MKTNLLLRKTGIILILIILGLIILSKKSNSTLKTVGKIIPENECRIVLNLPDNLSIETRYHLSSQPMRVKNFNFDRGDEITLKFFPQLFTNAHINKNDTLGNITSQLLDAELVRLSGALSAARTLLQAGLSGEKISVIEEAKNQLQLKKTVLSEQKIIVARLVELKKSNLVSSQEFELANNYLKICEIEVAAATSNLKIVSTGEKPEAIRVLQENINSLQKELSQLQTRKDHYSILSPIDGITTFSSDTMLTISNMNSLGVIFPIKLSRLDNIEIGQKVDIVLPELKKKTSAEIIKIDRQITTISGNQILLVTAKLENNTFPNGAIVKCNVKCKSERIYKNILNMFRYIEIN